MNWSCLRTLIITKNHCPWSIVRVTLSYGKSELGYSWNKVARRMLMNPLSVGCLKWSSYTTNTRLKGRQRLASNVRSDAQVKERWGDNCNVKEEESAHLIANLTICSQPRKLITSCTWLFLSFFSILYSFNSMHCSLNSTQISPAQLLEDMLISFHI